MGTSLSRYPDTGEFCMVYSYDHYKKENMWYLKDRNKTATISFWRWVEALRNSRRGASGSHLVFVFPTLSLALFPDCWLYWSAVTPVHHEMLSCELRDGSHREPTVFQILLYQLPLGSLSRCWELNKLRCVHLHQVWLGLFSGTFWTFSSSASPKIVQV